MKVRNNEMEYVKLGNTGLVSIFLIRRMYIKTEQAKK